MAEQSKAAIDEADAVFFMVDAASGIAASDQTVADMLHVERQAGLVGC